MKTNGGISSALSHGRATDIGSAMAWVNLKNIMLSDTREEQKSTLNDPK